jgi:hypothetical protein
MNSTLLLSRCGLCRALALAGVALVGACNTDNSLAPTADHVPTSPVLAKGAKGGPHATWAEVDKITGDTLLMQSSLCSVKAMSLKG